MAAPYLRNTIVLKGDLGRRHEEWVAAAALKPGHLLMLNSSNKVLKQSLSGAVNPKFFAKENALAGKTKEDAYAADDIVPVHVAQIGDLIQMRLPAAAAAVSVSDLLISNGDGTVIKGTAAAGQLVYKNTAASAAITASSTEALFDKDYTFAANSLLAGDVVRVQAQVIATATNATDTLTVKLYIGGLSGTAIVSSGALDATNNDVCIIDATVIFRTVGATGTLVASGFVTIGVAGTATAKPFYLGSTVVDTTAAQKIAVSGKWSTTDAGNSARLDMLSVELLRSSGGTSGPALAMASEAVDNSLGADEAFISAWIL